MELKLTAKSALRPSENIELNDIRISVIGASEIKSMLNSFEESIDWFLAAQKQLIESYAN
jgi:hypothetical protein